MMITLEVDQGNYGGGLSSIWIQQGSDFISRKCLFTVSMTLSFQLSKNEILVFLAVGSNLMPKYGLEAATEIKRQFRTMCHYDIAHL